MQRSKKSIFFDQRPPYRVKDKNCMIISTDTERAVIKAAIVI